MFHEDQSGLSNNPSINSTGFSRVVLILAVILIYYDLTKKYFYNFNNYFVLFIFYIDVSPI